MAGGQDRVDFHPAWHKLLTILCAEGVHASPWAEPRGGAHVARAARFVMMNRVEAGSLCPVTMTFGSVPAIRRDPEIAAAWLPKILSRRYDPSFRPASEKTGCLIGMGMTEKQGGSDVRTNATRAEPIPGTERAYTLVGHKWFPSAPMCDAFLVTAQAPFKGGAGFSWCVKRRRQSPAPSARPASPEKAGAPSGRCRRGSTSKRFWIEPSPEPISAWVPAPARACPWSGGY